MKCEWDFWGLETGKITLIQVDDFKNRVTALYFGVTYMRDQHITWLQVGYQLMNDMSL